MNKISVLLWTILFLSHSACTAPPEAINLPPKRITFQLAHRKPAPDRVKAVIKGIKDPVYLSREVLMTNRHIRKAYPDNGPYGRPRVMIHFTADGSALFRKITGIHKGKMLAIVIDGKAVSAPIIQEEITGGRAVISGPFTLQETKEISDGISPVIHK